MAMPGCRSGCPELCPLPLDSRARAPCEKDEGGRQGASCRRGSMAQHATLAARGAPRRRTVFGVWTRRWALGTPDAAARPLGLGGGPRSYALPPPPPGAVCHGSAARATAPALRMPSPAASPRPRPRLVASRHVAVHLRGARVCGWCGGARVEWVGSVARPRQVDHRASARRVRARRVRPRRDGEAGAASSLARAAASHACAAASLACAAATRDAPVPSIAPPSLARAPLACALLSAPASLPAPLACALRRAPAPLPAPGCWRGRAPGTRAR